MNAGSFVIHLLKLVSNRNLFYFEDNREAIDLSKNPKFLDRTKCIDVYFYSRRERFQNDESISKSRHWKHAINGGYVTYWPSI